MFTPFWWQRFFAKSLTAAPLRKRSGVSTCRVELEVLEKRLMPANIYVTGNVTNSTNSNDPSRFLDGPVSPLTPFSGSYLARNLRSAVVDSQAFAGSSTIFLDSNALGTYTLEGDQLLISWGPSTALTIKARSGIATIDAQHESRIFEVSFSPGTKATLDHLELTNGMAEMSRFTSSQGGAILNQDKLILTNDLFVNNKALGYGGNRPQWGVGGALYENGNSTASATIKNCTFDGNQAIGGSPNSTFFNAGGGEGGAVFISNGSGPVTITASTFSNNQANGGDANSSGGEGGTGGPGLGGAIALAQSSVSLKVVNSTFSGNSVMGGSGYGGGNGFGGAILTQNQNQVVLVNDTIANNQANGNEGIRSNGTGYGGGVGNFGGITTNPLSFVDVLNTIIATNMADGNNNDLFGTFQSLGHNFIGAATGSGFFATGDQTGTSGSPLDPFFDPAGLQNNGGPTQTIALLAYSNAINKGDNRVTTNSALMASLGIAPLTTDQRGPGFARKVDRIVDIGAYEFQMNLDKFYSFKSSLTQSVTLTVGAPGLLLGSAPFLPLANGGSFAVALEGNPPGGSTSLHVNPNGLGGFSFTVPPGYHNTVQFMFRVFVMLDDLTIPTNLVYVATINVTLQGFGRGSAGDYLGL
jgi:hypothetical protein